MSQKNPTRRLEGRLFADDGSLCMVVGVNPVNDTAEVSYRGQLIEMPMEKVTDRLSAYANLTLDNLNSETTVRRLVEHDGNWYFRTREMDLAGPYDSKEKANDAMNRYIINAQEGRVPEAR